MKPILFSSEMVRALLEGRKSQTRRFLSEARGTWWGHAAYEPRAQQDGTWGWYVKDTGEDAPLAADFRCPYGVPGDRLWVRETWALDEAPCCDGSCGHQRAIYRADVPDLREEASVRRFARSQGVQPFPWRPSIFMPRWASRLTLEITDVRVQRLQEIGAEDALAEGVGHTEFWTPQDVEGRPFEEKWWDDYEFWSRYPQIAYRKLWDSTNAKRAPWSSNPWVWCLTFKVIK